MGKKGKAKSSKPVRTKPRNTVSLILDGTVEQYLYNYQNSMSYLRYWLLCNAAIRVRIGNRLVYTTPLDETFYFALRYEQRYIVSIIVARLAWLVGFYTANGVFQMDFEGQSCPYMDSDQCQMTGFAGGHGAITAGVTGSTRLGLHRIRDCFLSVADYQGPDHPEAPGFRPAIGTFVIHLMEAKFREIFVRNCKAIIDPNFSRLGLDSVDWVQFLITNWSSLSEEGMTGIDQPNQMINNRGIVQLPSLGHILDQVFFLSLDAYNKGVFMHDVLPPEPRQMTWRPIDPGEGDGDIPLPVEKAASRLTGSKRGGSTLKDDKGVSKRKRGLTGGGAGGPSDVPEWFLKWEQRDDKMQCDEVQLHLSKLGLFVKQQQCSASSAASPEPASTSAAPDPGTPDAPAPLALCHDEAKLYRGDLDSLEEGALLTDGAIDFVLAHINSSFANQDDILLVRPAQATVLGNLEDPLQVAAYAQPLLLGSRRLVLLPVNNVNREDLDVPDSGNHWSLLVVHISQDGGSCRFVHHDSVGKTNLNAARRLADALRPLLPQAPELIEGLTPQQGNGYDCGLYVLAASRVICCWWAESGRPGIGDCWFQAVMSKIDAARVTELRRTLWRKFNKDMEKLASGSNK